MILCYLFMINYTNSTKRMHNTPQFCNAKKPLRRIKKPWHQVQQTIHYHQIVEHLTLCVTWNQSKMFYYLMILLPRLQILTSQTKLQTWLRGFTRLVCLEPLVIMLQSMLCYLTHRTLVSVAFLRGHPLFLEVYFWKAFKMKICYFNKYFRLKF